MTVLSLTADCSVLSAATIRNRYCVCMRVCVPVYLAHSSFISVSAVISQCNVSTGTAHRTHGMIYRIIETVSIVTNSDMT